MLQSPSNLTLQRVIAFGILWACNNLFCVAQQPPAADAAVVKSAEKHDHGLPEILSQHLVRDRQIELHLRSAESVRDIRDLERLRESLLPIFAAQHDLFEIDAGEQSARSVRARAMALLLRSSPELQRGWVESNRVISKQELETAIRRGGRQAVAQVAQQFPLTEAGLQAEVINMTCALLKGDAHGVDVRIRQLDELYTGTTLHSELQRQLRPLKELLTTAAGCQESADSARLSISSQGSGDTTAPPWPVPLWTWREAIWSFPGAPQMETGNLLSGFDSEAPNRFDDFNNWQSFFWEGDIVIRTPFRIVALDRANGQEHWSVPTDTFTRVPDSTYEARNDLMNDVDRRQQSAVDLASPIYGMAEFGLMSADRDFLFFIDGFEFLSQKDPFADNPTGKVIRNLNGFPVIDGESDPFKKSVASRLVAIQRTTDLSLPIVSWQIGDRESFAYQAVPKVVSLDSHPESAASTAIDLTNAPSGASTETIATPDQTWQGHRFLSPPTGLGTQLYVLTRYESQLFLNCLQRNSGRLLWRQPLAYTDENTVSFIDRSIFTQSASVCLVSETTVVCSLADGMLIGVNALDGTLKWATAIRDAASAAPQFRFGRAFPMHDDESSISSPSILVPCISNEIIVCCNHHSAAVYGLSLQTGEILWKSSRRAFGAGEVGGSPDYYVAGISQDQVIMIGDRHCRSLDLKTGDQNWVVEIHENSGRAECRGNRCVIPIRSGPAVAVDLAIGKVIPQSVLEPPENSIDPYGAVTSDDELTCVATPTGVTVFSRVDTVLKNVDQLPALAANPTKQVLVQAQAHLINGDFNKALNLLRDAVVSRSPDDPSGRQLDEALAELILDQWGQAIQSHRESQQATQQLPGKLSANSIPPVVSLLSQLRLPTDLEFRAAVFGRLSESIPARSLSSALEEIALERNWKSAIRMTNQWSVRPDLLVDNQTPDLRMDQQSFNELSLQELRQLAGDFLQHPEAVPDAAAFQHFASHLLSRGEFAAVELCLIRWCEFSSTTDRTSRTVASELLTQLRSPVASSISSSQIEGITSAVSDPLTFELLPFIRTPDADFEALNRQLWLDSLPAHCRLHAYLTNDVSLTDDAVSQAKLMTVDPLDASVRDELALPFLVDRTAGNFLPLSDGDMTPSLFPVSGVDEIAMISCPVPGSASVLWRRSLHSAASDRKRVEFGSLGSEHLIWQYGDGLHCTDPLTGEDLWSRTLTLSQSEEAILNRGFNPSVRRIAGDRHTTIVMGSDSRSYERFNTRDGARMSSGRLNISRSESVVAVGRCLLYTDSNGQLRLFDSRSEEDQLADVAPIQPVIRDHRILCQILENDRVLVVSETPDQLELIMIDVSQGTVLFRSPLSNSVRHGFVFSLSAFERHGRLFVALSGGGRSERSIQHAFMRGSPFLFSGPLVCLNPVNGEMQWSVEIDQAVFPDIHGDPTDLLICWSAPKSIQERNIGARSEDRLMLQVFDEATGQLIAQSPSFSSLPPLRCVHIAAEHLIQLDTPNATISIRAFPEASGAYQ
jgi:outer membrane protein assembly factor BamB